MHLECRPSSGMWGFLPGKSTSVPQGVGGVHAVGLPQSPVERPHERRRDLVRNAPLRGDHASGAAPEGSLGKAGDLVTQADRGASGFASAENEKVQRGPAAMQIPHREPAVREAQSTGDRCGRLESSVARQVGDRRVCKSIEHRGHRRLLAKQRRRLPGRGDVTRLVGDPRSGVIGHADHEEAGRRVARETSQSQPDPEAGGDRHRESLPECDAIRIDRGMQRKSVGRTGRDHDEPVETGDRVGERRDAEVMHRTKTSFGGRESSRRGGGGGVRECVVAFGVESDRLSEPIDFGGVDRIADESGARSGDEDQGDRRTGREHHEHPLVRSQFRAKVLEFDRG